MRAQKSANERLNAIVIIGVLVTANVAMIIAVIAAAFVKLPVEIVITLFGLPSMVCSGLIGFIARDVMRSHQASQEPTQSQQEEESK